ncbi:hypothetical protein P9112_004881 [Eukaryota sp. TZLM1-RC]
MTMTLRSGRTHGASSSNICCFCTACDSETTIYMTHFHEPLVARLPAKSIVPVSFSCPKCQDFFPSISSLITHLDLCYTTSDPALLPAQCLIIKCLPCGMSFQLSSVSRHLSQCPSSLLTTPSTNTLPSASPPSKKPRLDNRVQDKTENGKKFCCFVHCKGSYTRSGLIQHIRDAHPAQLLSSGGTDVPSNFTPCKDKVVCALCTGKVLVDKQLAVDHIVDVHLSSNYVPLIGSKKSKKLPRAAFYQRYLCRCGYYAHLDDDITRHQCKLKCPYCSFQSAEVDQNFVDHVTRNHSQMCIKEVVKLDVPKSIESFVKSQDSGPCKNPLFNCSQCSFSANIQQLVTHLIKDHSDGKAKLVYQQPPPAFSCVLCNQALKVKNATGLLDHFKSFHRMSV